MKNKKADIITVANAAGVSPATVSRFFNRPELVNAATKKRIDLAVKEVGYIRNRAAQTIHGIRSGTIGLLVPTIDNTIFAEVIQAFSDRVGESGFTILLGTHNYDEKREYAVLRKLMEHRVDGIALVGLDHSAEVFILIESQNMPTVLLWNYDPAARLSCVGVDNEAAGRTIADYAIAQGHQRFATLFPPLRGNDRATSRAKGVRAALDAAGIALDQADQLETRYSLSDAKSAVQHFLATRDRPDVIICGNDVLALGAIYAAQSVGLRVPQDLRVTGIGDFKGSKDVEPTITTVRIPAQSIGQTGGDAMVAAITTPDIPRESLCCPCTLVVRASC